MKARCPHGVAWFRLCRVCDERILSWATDARTLTNEEASSRRRLLEVIGLSTRPTITVRVKS